MFPCHGLEYEFPSGARHRCFIRSVRATRDCVVAPRAAAASCQLWAVSCQPLAVSCLCLTTRLPAVVSVTDALCPICHRCLTACLRLRSRIFRLYHICRRTRSIPTSARSSGPVHTSVSSARVVFPSSCLACSVSPPPARPRIKPRPPSDRLLSTLHPSVRFARLFSGFIFPRARPCALWPAPPPDRTSRQPRPVSGQSPARRGRPRHPMIEEDRAV